jgi:energy-coupling factor transport system ATP-binding protein
VATMIAVENLIHKYGANPDSTPALDGLNFTIKRGEFVAIVGSNGSGKSTLAKHFNALLLPTTGTVAVEGMDTQDLKHLWDIRQRVGMVFQNPDNQIVAAIVEEDVAFGPENLGLPPVQIRDRVTEALKLVDMLDYRHHGPHLLSGGQKQRVAIAGVIAMRPACIVLDEPTAMLDPLGRREVLDTIKRLNKEEGITVVHITHFMDEAVTADRVVAMQAGKIVLDGPPRHVFSQVSAVRGLGLDVPDVTALARALRSQGVAVPQDVLTVEEMVVALCR